MTAEGDNSVLMQKVAKERLTAMAKGDVKKLSAPSSTNLTDQDYLLYLLNAREQVLFKKLGEKMAAAGKAGMFDTWMLEESDLIQAAARAFGDRLIAERYNKCSRDCRYLPYSFVFILRFGETLKTCDGDLKPVLSKVFSLYMTTILERNLTSFLTSGLISPAQVIIRFIESRNETHAIVFPEQASKDRIRSPLR